MNLNKISFNLKINFSSVLIIVVLSSLLGLTTNYLNYQGIPLIKSERVLNWATDSSEIKNTEEIIEDNNKTNSEAKFDEAAAITLKQAYALYNKNVLFVDARDYVEYEIGHIKGAISLPYYEFDEYKSVLQSISKNTPLVTYCDGRDCDLSIMLGDKLFELGYKQVYIFFDGWIDWQDNNYPVESDE
ncbi:MAG: rhodanese-like domain-containing protein [Bacteroidetes bacterium]|nr:rhodanese-like domain-containing protein [Bacteroidota bacterium]